MACLGRAWSTLRLVPELLPDPLPTCGRIAVIGDGLSWLVSWYDPVGHGYHGVRFEPMDVCTDLLTGEVCMEFSIL